MKEKTVRIIALGFALALAAVFVFFPTHELWKRENNSGRKKTEVTAGNEYSWTWIPEETGISSVSVRLSGARKAPELILNLSLKEESGREITSVRQKLSDLAEGLDEILLNGQPRQGKACVLSIEAEGEGSVKLRGDYPEDTDAFEPSLTVMGSKVVRNPVLLYFAAGAVLAALTPVTGKGTKPSRKKETYSAISRILPLLTFLMIASLGIYIAVRRPMYTILGDWRTWDEDTHWEIVQQMGLFRKDGIRRAAYELITWAPGYAPLAAGYNLAQIFSSDEEILYRCAAACSSICYAGTAALAVKHAPRYKTSFLMAGTIPVIIFLMTSMSYDTVVIGSILLGTALLLETLDREEQVSPVRAVAMISVMAFGTVAKPAYSLVLLTLLMIPASRLGGKKNARVFRLFVILMLVWCAAAMKMPGAYDDVMEGDWRFDGSSMSGQIAWIMQHPVEGVMRPIESVLSSVDSLLVGDMAHWGYLGNNLTAVKYYLWLMLVISPLCSAGEARNQESCLTVRRRIIFALIAFGMAVIIAFAQFLVSTPAGDPVQGMQARYGIPVWILVLLAAMWPQFIRCRPGKAGEWASLAVWAACLVINVQNMMGYFNAYGAP